MQDCRLSFLLVLVVAGVVGRAQAQTTCALPPPSVCYLATPCPASAPPQADPSPWGVFGIGIALATASAIMFVVAADEGSHAHAPALSALASGAMISDANTISAVADVLLVVGATAAFIGLVWAIANLASLDRPCGKALAFDWRSGSWRF